MKRILPPNLVVANVPYQKTNSKRLLGGPLRFYAGFPTYYVRIAPHAMLTLIAQDFIKKSYMVSLEMERWKFCGLQVAVWYLASLYVSFQTA